MGKFWFLCTLVLIGGNAAAQTTPQKTPVDWRVSAQFPQVRENVPFRGVRWRTPVVPDEAGHRLESVLPWSSETWTDPDAAHRWYERVARRGFSPYAESTSNDAWIERSQSYDPTFLSYIRSDAVYVKVSAPNGMVIRDGCTWRMDGVEVGLRQGCIDAELLVPTAGATISLWDGGQAVAESRIVPQRLVILGLGDSYAAGEGNPDRPTRWSNDPLRVPADPVERLDWLMHSSDSPNPRVLEDAEWRDPVCHRSFWNQQSYVAMQVAAQDPHREVVFLQFACSGAEILDGLLVRQVNPPGISADDKRGCASVRLAKCRVNASQLAAAVSALCVGKTTRADDLVATITPRIVNNGAHRWQKLAAYRHHNLGTNAPLGFDLLECDGRLLPPGVVLLSVGGNDGGFASLLAWALMPTTGHITATWPLIQAARALTVICPEGISGWGCPSPSARTFASQLKARFALLDQALESTGLAVDSRKVVMSSYPNPLRTGRTTSGGAPELCADDTAGPSPWEALNAGVPKHFRALGNWSFYLRNRGSGRNAAAATIMDRSVLPDLWNALAESAAESGFTFVPEMQQAFVGHTWCNETATEQARLALPSTSPDAWGGGLPASWQPFLSRARAIRTANDSYMTQLSTRSGDGNGTMHPTAEGQLLLAMPVYEATRLIAD